MKNTKYLPNLLGIFFLLLFLSPASTSGQNEVVPYAYPTFEDTEVINIIKQSIDEICNQRPEAAEGYINQLKVMLPEHPAPIMLEAISISWQHMPLNPNMKAFERHELLLEKTIEKAEELLKANSDHVEGVFYQMTARGLLAEYYAMSGNYVKALGQAKRTYTLIKKGFELVDEYPEFLFIIGLYNYFREKYPEKHPIVKPVFWFFKSGDVSTGLTQLDKATRQSLLTKEEAKLYLSYIYLRYENEPGKAISYLEDLNRSYPDNKYFQAKLAESYTMNGYYDRAEVFIEQLLRNPIPYYRLAGESFKGIWLEKYVKANKPAFDFYKQAIETAQQINRGSYYHGLALLGIGRISYISGNYEAAIINFEKALQISDAAAIQEEGKKYLKKLR